MSTLENHLPKVSIIIPCYNDPKYVNKSVNSALNQTYPEKEIIVVDDGSNIKTRQVLKDLESSIDLLITQENLGLSSARNAGITGCKGDFILVLDSDDFFEKDFCEKAIPYFANYPDCKLVTCQATRFNNIGVLDIFTPRGGELENFLFSNSAIGNSMFKRSDWEKAGFYDEKMKLGFEDWEFFIRLLSGGGKAYVIEEPLFNYRQKDQSMRKSANAIKYEIMEYIFLKHKVLYQNNFIAFTKNMLYRLKKEEAEKIKILEQAEFKIGKSLLTPLRFLKSFITRK